MPTPPTETFVFNPESRRTMLCVVLDSAGTIERCGEDVVIRVRDPYIFERTVKLTRNSTPLIAPPFERMHTLVKDLPE